MHNFTHFRFRLLLTGLLALLIQPVCTPALYAFKHGITEPFAYSYAGNFDGQIRIPELPGKRPVIIYMYHQFYDQIGRESLVKKGYNIDHFITEFERNGFISIIPTERQNKLNALKGAIEFARRLPEADPNQIHIIGFSHGACYALLLGETSRLVRTITVLTPIPVYDNGYFSLPNLIRVTKTLNTPVLFLISNKDQSWNVSRSRLIHDILLQNRVPMQYKEYDERATFFYLPINAWMADTIAFIQDYGNLPKDLL